MDPGLRRDDVGQGLARLKAPDQASQPSPRRRPGPITSTQARNRRNQSRPAPGRRLRARRQPIAPDPRLTRQPFTPCDKLRQICSYRSSGRKRPGPRTVIDEAVEAGFPPVARSPGGRRVKRDERKWNPRTNAPGPRVLFFIIRSSPPARLRTAAFLRFRCSRPSRSLRAGSRRPPSSLTQAAKLER